jgi:hypothetical protein
MAAGAGLVIVALAGQAAVRSDSVALPLWWVGVLVIVVPIFLRLWSTRATVHERAVLVVLLGLAFWAVRLLVSPIAFEAPDEFSHLRTWEDLVTTGRALLPNPLLLISPSYPGLEGSTAAVGFTSGLPVFAAGTILIGVARATLMLALFLLIRSVSGSARIAGLGSAIYAANPSFLFFDAQWSYESLALTLAVLAIWMTWRWSSLAANRTLHATAAVVFIGATTVTHHLTSFVLTALLVAWAVAASLRPGRQTRRSLTFAAATAIVMNIGWLLFVAGPALDYLTGIVYGAFEALLGMSLGGGTGRPLFRQLGEFTTPAMEIAVGYLGTAVLLFALLLAAFHALRRHNDQPLYLVFCAAALLFPVTLALRLTGEGAETSQRASGFLYLGFAVLVADWLVHVVPGTRRILVRVTATALLTLVLAAGIVLGNAWFTRMPGPYRVAAEQLSIEPLGVTTAEWSRQWLGPRNRIIADRTNQKLLASIGAQDPVTAFNSSLGTAWVMWEPELTDDDRAVIRDGRIDYVLADLRTTRDTPIFPVYFEGAEPNAGEHEVPWPAAGLAKFDQIPGVGRVFDAGDLILYDVRALRDGER